MAEKSLIGIIRDGLLGNPSVQTGGGVEVMPAQQPQMQYPEPDAYMQKAMAQEASQLAMQDNLNKAPQNYELSDFAFNEGMVKDFGVSLSDLNEGLQAYKGVTHGVEMLNDIEGKKGKGIDTKKEESFFDQVADGAKKMFGNEEKMLSLALAFNTMRMTPDQGLASHLSGRLKTIRENKVSDVQAQQTIKQLMDMGEVEAAKMVQANPKMYKEIMKQVAQKKFAKGASPTISGLQTDPSTGQQYVVRTNPNTGKSERINIEGAFGQTPEQKAAIENEQQERQFGIRQAQEKSAELFTMSQSMDSQIRNLNEMLVALDNGADSGKLVDFLPAFDAATASLRAAANRLGIDIINSATFGALSEQELKLALRTAVDLSLNPADLRKSIMQKLAAQQKLRNELNKDALMLTQGGVTFNNYIQEKLQTVTPLEQQSVSQGKPITDADKPSPSQAKQMLKELHNLTDAEIDKL